MSSAAGIAIAAATCAALATPASALAQSFSTTEIQQAVDAHNLARCQVHPAAASMPAVTWDETLAMVAQNWAMRAQQFSHNPNRNRQYRQLGGKEGSVGENMSLLSASLASIGTVVASWVSERQSYAFHAVSSNDTESNHYTQIVWSATRRIGCGKARRWDNRFLYVCNYAPAGNVVGRFPYAAGNGTTQACSAVKR